MPACSGRSSVAETAPHTPEIDRAVRVMAAARRGNPTRVIMRAIAVAEPDVLLLGATSLLGWSLLRAAPVPVLAVGNRDGAALPAGIAHGINLDDELAMVLLFRAVRPALVIHCAGVCNVETCERSPAFARSVNVEGTRILLRHAPAEARIVYCSSDHVFGGDHGPYDEAAPTAPISVYGETRVAAEALVRARGNSLVIRPGLWIGPSATGRVGMLDWLRHRHGKQLPMTLVTDEVRSAVWAEDAARRVWELARTPLVGVRHLTATRAVARPALARYLIEHFAPGAAFTVEPRSARRWPHLGDVTLATRFTDPLAAALPAACV